MDDPARAVWGLGHYDAIAERLVPAADALCEAAGVRTGARVLDVAAGTGNVALAAAARGANVVATDFAPPMLERGRERTAGTSIVWREADVQELPFPNDSFDIVLSAFGAIFAPEPRRATAEMVRVTAPGGVLALTAWPVDGAQGAAFDVIRRHLPVSATPWGWGDSATARRHFRAAGVDVEIRRRSMPWAFPGGLAEWMRHYEEDAPPIAAARAALGDGWVAVRDELMETVGPRGRVEPNGTYVVDTDYLLIRGAVPR